MTLLFTFRRQKRLIEMKMEREGLNATEYVQPKKRGLFGRLFGGGQKERQAVQSPKKTEAVNGIGAILTTDSINKDTDKDSARESDVEIVNDEEVILKNRDQLDSNGASAEKVLSKRFAGTRKTKHHETC